MRMTMVTVVGMALAAGSPVCAQGTRAIVGDGIVRYDASFISQVSAPPSFTLVDPLPILGTAAAGLPGEPAFGTEPDGRRRVSIDVGPGASVYGTGLVTGPLERTGEFTTLWNTDAPGWVDSNPSLYQSHPWVLIVNADGSATGVLFDTIARSDVDTTGSTGPEVVFRSEEQNVATYVINKPTPQDVVRTLADMTGTADLPPLWSLGYHQSRGSYTSANTVRTIAQELRSRRIPCDVVWIDVGYMDGFRMFTWSQERVPDPAGLIADLAADGFDAATSLGGFIRVDPAWSTYNEAVNQNLVVLDPSGNAPFVGDVWPGPCVFVDSLNAGARDWFADGISDFLSSSGVSGVWIDMNEPAVFSPEKTISGGAQHQTDAALGGPGPHAAYHNAYGFQLSRAAREGHLRARPNTRPWTLSRAGFLGGQRYTQSWSGDNRASWYHVDVSIPQVLNLGLSGQPFSGPDIGGYLDDIDPQMYRRWMGLGLMLPFARQHTAGDESPPKEPWVFGAETERVSRLAVQRRYRLLPHIYTLAHEAATTGLPLVRPVFFAEPADPGLRTIDDAFLLGEGVIVAAATSPGAEPVTPDLPGRELRFGFREINASNSPFDTCVADLPELSLRAGHIVPYDDRIVQSTKDGYAENLGLLVAFDAHGEASGRYYEDDGRSFDYQSGAFLLTTYRATRDGGTVTLEVASEAGQRARPVGRELTVRILLDDDVEHRVRVAEPRPGVPTVIEGVPFETDLGGDACGLPGVLDGRDIPMGFGAAVATQAVPTLIGDNVNELNQLFASVDPGALRLGVTGNVGSNAVLMVFVDADGRGAGTVSGLLGEAMPVSSLAGTTFDAGFEPETLLVVRPGGDGSYEATVYDGLGSGAVSVTPVGRGLEGVGTSALLRDDDWSGGAPLIAFDDGNAAGVTGQSAAGAATATSGFEIELPAEFVGGVGPICGSVRVLAAIVATTGAFGNQVLPPALAAGGLPAFAPDFAGVPGQQWGELAGVGLDFAAPFGVIDFFDLLAFAALVDDGDAGADIDADGVVDSFDVLRYVEIQSLCDDG